MTDYYDISGKIGDLFPTQNPEWPMYSFDRPGSILWNAIAGKLHEAGWKDKRIKEWLQSKEPRWALDGALGGALKALGEGYALTQLLGGATAANASGQGGTAVTDESCITEPSARPTGPFRCA